MSAPQFVFCALCLAQIGIAMFVDHVRPGSNRTWPVTFTVSCYFAVVWWGGFFGGAQ